LGELDELPARELARWAQYWSEEPWGSVRDNMHAGLIITELMKPHLPEGVTMSIDQFMLKSKAELDEVARARIVAALSAMAAAGERAARREKKS
jgi:hypothetical protein